MARFAPDGETIFYGAAWDGKPVELFAMQCETSDSRPLGVAGQGRVLGGIGMGRMLAVFNRFDHWQVGYVFPKGLYQLIRAQGLDVIASLLGLAPWVPCNPQTSANHDLTTARLAHG